MKKLLLLLLLIVPLQADIRWSRTDHMYFSTHATAEIDPQEYNYLAWLVNICLCAAINEGVALRSIIGDITVRLMNNPSPAAKLLLHDMELWWI